MPIRPEPNPPPPFVKQFNCENCEDRRWVVNIMGEPTRPYVTNRRVCVPCPECMP